MSEQSDVWEIRTEGAGVGFDLSTGRPVAEPGTRIKFRRKGAKGRFQSFVVVGEVPQDLGRLVAAYLRKQSAPTERRKEG